MRARGWWGGRAQRKEECRPAGLQGQESILRLAGMRGSQHETSPGVHMLNAFSTRLQAAVGSLAVPPDSGECIEALQLLKTLPLDGAVVTGDAAFTLKPIVEAIRERGGDYFLFVKANQPELRTGLERAFGDVPPCGSRRRRAAHGERAA